MDANELVLRELRISKARPRLRGRRSLVRVLFIFERANRWGRSVLAALGQMQHLQRNRGMGRTVFAGLR